MGKSPDNWFEERAVQLLNARSATAAVRLFRELHRRFGELESENARLASSVARYQDLIEHVRGGLWVIDREGRTTFASVPVATMLEKRVEEMAAVNILDCLTPPDANSFRAWLHQDLSGKVRQTDLTLRRSSGLPLHVRTSCVPTIDKAGQWTEVVLLLLDISEQRQAEEAFLESERRFQTLADAAFEGICVSEHDRIVDCNQHFASMLGYEVGELLGRPIADLVPNACLDCCSSDGCETCPETVAESDDAGWHERELTRRDGTRRVVETRGKTAISRGRPLRIQVLRDITERRATELRLRESEFRLRQALQIGRSLTYEWDPQTDVVIRQPEWADILGLKGGDAFANTGAAYMERIVPDDRAQLQLALQRLTPESDTYVTNYRLQRDDGSLIYIEESARAVFNERGEFVRLMGIGADVTEKRHSQEALRQSEERLRLALEGTRDAMWDVDLTTRKIARSDRWFEMRGLEPDHCAHSADCWSERIHSEDRARATQAIDDHLASRTPQYTCEYRTRHRDGSYIWVFDRGVAIRGPHGEPIRILGFETDVTERKRVEAQLKSLNESLEQRVAEQTAESQWRAAQLQKLAARMTEVEDRERRRLAVILHDGIQQLLAAASLRIGVVAQADPAGRIGKMATESLALVNQAIQESRSLSMELSPPILYELGLGEALRWLARDTECKYSLPVDAEISLETESKDLTLRLFIFHAARELILNAVKHAKASRLRLRLTSAHPNFLQLDVQDDGVGFVPPSGDEDSSGGFGLFSIRERLAAIGGELRVLSNVGAGTKATIVAPYRPLGLSSLASDQSGKFLVPSPLAPLRSQRIRIVVVDDHPVMRAGVIEMLSEHPDLTVVGEAANGLEAIDRVRDLLPEIVLMDTSMPLMDGIEATRKIKEAWPEIRVVAFSMHESETMADHMKSAGASIFVTKSAPIEELVKSILSVASPRQEIDDT